MCFDGVCFAMRLQVCASLLSCLWAAICCCCFGGLCLMLCCDLFPVLVAVVVVALKCCVCERARCLCVLIYFAVVFADC